jgi:hypothetical protein
MSTNHPVASVPASDKPCHYRVRQFFRAAGHSAPQPRRPTWREEPKASAARACASFSERASVVDIRKEWFARPGARRASPTLMFRVALWDGVKTAGFPHQAAGSKQLTSSLCVCSYRLVVATEHKTSIAFRKAYTRAGASLYRRSQPDSIGNPSPSKLGTPPCRNHSPCVLTPRKP